VGTRTGRSEAWRLAGSAVRGEPYALYGRHAWPQVFAAWKREQSQAAPQVLYLDHLDSFMYISRAARPAAPAVLDLHNVYSRLALRAAEPAGPWTRAWLRLEAQGLARVERRAARRCDLVFAVSDLEAEYFRRLRAQAVKTVPNGVDISACANLPVGRGGPPVVLFLGSLSWPPNVSAARFLATDVLPALRILRPDTRLLIVGRDPVPEVTQLEGPGIEVVGPVPDVTPFLARASVLAVPLDAGGGTRLKILEAFAAGLPVVSTRVGAEGLDANAGVHYLAAERPEFVRVLADLVAAPARGRELAIAARQLAAEQYDWRRIGADAAAAIVELGNRGKAA
jgi:glycosyltransferase involved in cell wall biosynthesis